MGVESKEMKRFIPIKSGISDESIIQKKWISEEESKNSTTFNEIGLLLK
jgi:hypothetical protein